MTQVGAPSSPILVSIETQCAALRPPGAPPSPTRYFGTRNRLMPFTPGGASGSLASTRWTMFSVRSCSPQVMKILVPVIP